eukprot:scaffold34407_cov34-Attheya_sp.AAC.1
MELQCAILATTSTKDMVDSSLGGTRILLQGIRVGSRRTEPNSSIHPCSMIWRSTTTELSLKKDEL